MKKKRKLIVLIICLIVLIIIFKKLFVFESINYNLTINGNKVNIEEIYRDDNYYIAKILL